MLFLQMRKEETDKAQDRIDDIRTITLKSAHFQASELVILRSSAR